MSSTSTSHASREQQHVVVLGAGVIGLTSAFRLAESGYRVSIVAAHTPGDVGIEYTSPSAGAHWRTLATSEEPVLCDWDVQTYQYWQKILALEAVDPSQPKSGLKAYSSHTYWDGPITEDLWWSTQVQDFGILSNASSHVQEINKRASPSAPDIQNAVTYTSVAINVPQHLLYLQSQAESLGVKTFRYRFALDKGLAFALRDVERLIELEGQGSVDLFVNATGINARQLCGDHDVYPIRGQTILVKGEANSIRLRLGDGYLAYCIPRPGSGTTILAGTKEENNWSVSVDDLTSSKILERNWCMVPELLNSEGQFEVLSAQCGLRPARKGGPRVESELVDGLKVVHTYGHGGGGYQNSLGSARKVVQLVQESLRDILQRE